MYHLNSISSIIECFAFTKTALFAKWHMQSVNVKIPSKMTLRVCDVKYNVTRNRSYSDNVFNFRKLSSFHPQLHGYDVQDTLYFKIHESLVRSGVQDPWVGLKWPYCKTVSNFMIVFSVLSQLGR